MSIQRFSFIWVLINDFLEKIEEEDLFPDADSFNNFVSFIICYLEEDLSQVFIDYLWQEKATVIQNLELGESYPQFKLFKNLKKVDPIFRNPVFKKHPFDFDNLYSVRLFLKDIKEHHKDIKFSEKKEQELIDKIISHVEVNFLTQYLNKIINDYVMKFVEQERKKYESDETEQEEEQDEEQEQDKDSESMLIDSEDSESMLIDSEDSESIDETKPVEDPVLIDSEDSESIDETKPVEDPDRWNSERFKHLWFLCDNCDTAIYKDFFLEQKGVCLECGATLQLTSSERIQLLLDNGSWCPMNMILSSMDVLDKKHTTFDIKMVENYSFRLYQKICDSFFHNQFLKQKNALKILVKYNSTLVDIVNVVVEKKFIRYLNFDSKTTHLNADATTTIHIIADIIETGLNTFHFVLCEIDQKIINEFYWVRLLHPDPDLDHIDLDVSIDTSIDTSLDTSIDDKDYTIFTYLLNRSVDMKQRILLQHQHLNKHLINLKLLFKFKKKLDNLVEKLLSQIRFLLGVTVFATKIEFYFPEEKRKMRKIKKMFPFYPGNDPEINYFLWLRKHMSICLMETYLVFKQFRLWFNNRCYGLLEEFYRFGLKILAEYLQDRYDLFKKERSEKERSEKERYDSENMIDHIMDENMIDHIMDESININISDLKSSQEIQIGDDFSLYYKEKAEAPVSDPLWAFCLLELMKQFSAISIHKEKFQFCKKKKETYIEDTEDTADSEEEYPLTYASLTKEEQEYIDASVELIRNTILNLGKDEFLDTEEEELCYDDYNVSYQKETGLLDAIQTGIGKINGFTVALGVMDFQFMGGSMGSVVGEKISRLIQYATEHFLPLILVCASGGARMQEGSYSLMQMNKIAAVLHTHQKEKNLLYISVLTSPTTGGVTASFGMLGDVTIVEPNAYIAFAGKRVIEQTLNQIVDDDDQISDSLFDFGMFDSMVPRALLKNVLSEIIDLYMYGNYI
uniref:Acetyl-coenzyme A carboxylase carboxyl transferase subunit beta, chloroplastic n=1 Tax=Austrocedrus chilensis TaxID=103964 RepID=A0A6J4AEG5_AUSCH|nr:acetyl-CoA carboxylase carboxyltransferase beta subunit [Austrocedrus chilensis]BBN66451.1 acetyl-CoA carboxylase beta subunit [Austrocedrus chilensis]